jgi:hypothetical protein
MPTVQVLMAAQHEKVTHASGQNSCHSHHGMQTQVPVQSSMQKLAARHLPAAAS